MLAYTGRPTEPLYADRLGISGNGPTLPLMAWRSDLAGLREWQGEAWAAYTGHATHSAQRNRVDLADGVHVGDRELCEGIFRACVASGAPFTFDYRLRCHDGTYRWVMDRGLAQYTDHVLVGYTGVCVDIHARRMAEECLAERMRVLRLNERRRDTHLSEIGRDLRSLAAHVGGEGGATAAELPEWVRTRLDDALERIEALMSGAFVEPGSGARLVRVVDVLDVATRYVDPMLTHSGHRLLVDMPEPGMLLYGDALQLGRAIAGVVGYVGSSCEPPSQLGVTIRHDDDAVYLRIRKADEAQEPDFVPRAFELARRRGTTWTAPPADRWPVTHALQHARRVARWHRGDLLANSPGGGQPTEWVMRVALRR